MKFNKDFFVEHQKTLLSYLNSPIGGVFRRGMWIEDRKHPVVKLTPKACHVLLPNGQVRATFYSNPQYAQGLHQSYRPIWEAAHWWDMRLANRLMPALNVGFDTYGPLQPDETAGVDTLITSGAPGNNYGTFQYIKIGESNGSVSTERGLLKFDLSSASGGTFTNFVQYLYVREDASSNARTSRVYQILRNWVESQATWNIWSTGNNWTTAGCSSAGNDYNSTELANCSHGASDAIGSEKQWSFSADGLTYINNIVAGTANNYGWIIRMDTESNDQYSFGSSTFATAAQRPKVTGTYSLSGAGSGDFFFF